MDPKKEVVPKAVVEAAVPTVDGNLQVRAHIHQNHQGLSWCASFHAEFNVNPVLPIWGRRICPKCP